MASPSETCIVDVDVGDLDIGLHAPFGIAGGAQDAARNLLVRVRLASGAEGLGEAAPFPAVNGETQELARAALHQVRPVLLGHDASALRPLAALLSAQIPAAASARCAVETAVLDAWSRHHRLPLWAYFGGAQTALRTDMTITTGSVAAAVAAATAIRDDGFGVIKLKVGGVAEAEDRARIEAVVAAAPGVRLLLDGNCGLPGVAAAHALVQIAVDAGGSVVLFEQPLPRDDLDGMCALSALLAPAGVPVCADESVGTSADVVAVARAGAAQVVNIKIMKSGIVESLDMIATARAHGLGLMIGGMVESSLAMTMSACLAAGQGGFSFVDLDTPYFLCADPFDGEATRRGPDIDLVRVTSGHGVRAAAALRDRLGW